jgi:hypothetical protein
MFDDYFIVWRRRETSLRPHRRQSSVLAEPGSIVGAMQGVELLFSVAILAIGLVPCVLVAMERKWCQLTMETANSAAAGPTTTAVTLAAHPAMARSYVRYAHHNAKFNVAIRAAPRPAKTLAYLAQRRIAALAVHTQNVLCHVQHRATGCPAPSVARRN